MEIRCKETGINVVDIIKIKKYIEESDINFIKAKVLANYCKDIKQSNDIIAYGILKSYKDKVVIKNKPNRLNLKSEFENDVKFISSNLITSSINIESIIEKLNNTGVIKSDLLWIDSSNIRQCYYLASCLYLSNIFHQITNEIIPLEEKDFDFEHLVINRLNEFENTSSINLSTFSFKEHLTLNIESSPNIMYDHILLDIIVNSMLLNKNYQQQLKVFWLNANTIKYQWLDVKNKQQVDWAYCYLKKNHISGWFLPEADREDYIHKYYSSIVLLDLWPASQKINGLGNKFEFIEKMKRSWSQQKSRLKNKNKKTFTFSMESNVEPKIEKLCKDNHINKSKLIEKLINDAFDSL
ncbi:hypothetical protein [Vibrio cincinnatiensis]|uniref:hypothetical protein n=1 Tax=Vibrio cincinnatiensis TaxID=675 RepID=UPI001EDD096E|nr:hypothetical protein [Vibrio cincinnatiensis]MCG3728102.1 hypothetical protein [Vibrio cincinnatiensis]